MSIHIRCRECSSEFDVPDSFAGKQGKCPQCGKVMTAPKGEPAPAPARPRAGDSQVLSTPAPAAPRSGKSSAVLPRAKPLGEGGASDKPSSPAIPGLVLSSPSAAGAPMWGANLGDKARPPEGMPGWVWGVVAGAGVAVIAAIAVAIWAVSQPTVVATPGPNKPGTGGPTNMAQKVPGASGTRKPLSPLDVPKETEWNKVKTARSLPECTAAMVKIMFPTGGQSAVLGSGFLIDSGWVATNYHVIEKANSAIRCYMSDGKDYAVEGLLSQDKERNLAILKLKDMPFQMTLLDVTSQGNPDIGTEIYCYGHPHGVDFSVSSGVVGRVCQTDKLDDNSQAFLYSSHNTPPDMTWVQIDAKINPGNSGGPLIDKKNFKVLGVNSWVNQQVGFGYASHVQHLRDLIGRTTETVKEFPKPEKSKEFAGVAPLPDNFSAQMIQDKLKACQDFNWLPSSKSDHTTALLEFARLMHGAREIARNPEAAEGIPEARNMEINAAATSAWQVLAGLDWNAERVAAVNKVAARIMDKPGFGVIAMCECVAPEGQGPVLKIVGTEHHILASLDAPAIFDHGQKVLVIGLSTPLQGMLRSPMMEKSLKVHYVKSHFTRVIGK